jgi:hypothetical protein
MKHLGTGLLSLAALAFSAGAGAETWSFGAADIVWNPWTNPFDDSEFYGFRIGAPANDFWPDETPPPAGEVGFTAFAAAEYHWDGSTVVFGFAASPERSYAVDWADSWLEVNGTPTLLADFAPANAGATGNEWLAAHPWGGGGLNPDTTWYFDAPAEVFALTGGRIAYYVTSVPEAAPWAMLLAGLLGVGAAARRRAPG